jgi:hypothetical protein
MTKNCPCCGRELKYDTVPGAIIKVLPCECGRNGYMITGKKRKWES